MDDIQKKYINQMAKVTAKQVDDKLWLIIKKKPWWMPEFVYKAVIKNLVELIEERNKKHK